MIWYSAIRAYYFPLAALMSIDFAFQWTLMLPLVLHLPFSLILIHPHTVITLLCFSHNTICCSCSTHNRTGHPARMDILLPPASYIGYTIIGGKTNPSITLYVMWLNCLIIIYGIKFIISHKFIILNVSTFLLCLHIILLNHLPFYSNLSAIQHAFSNDIPYSCLVLRNGRTLINISLLFHSMPRLFWWFYIW